MTSSEPDSSPIGAARDVMQSLRPMGRWFGLVTLMAGLALWSGEPNPIHFAWGPGPHVSGTVEPLQLLRLAIVVLWLPLAALAPLYMLADAARLAVYEHFIAPEASPSEPPPGPRTRVKPEAVVQSGDHQAGGPNDPR